MPSPVPCTLTDEDIRTRTLEVFGKRPCLFQIRVCRAQLEQRNVISIAPTGSGKTLTYLMPLAFSTDSIIILVTALNVLGDQFVREAEAAGLPAVFVHAETNTDGTFTDIRQLKYRVVVMTPGILVERGGRCAAVLWPNKVFTSKLQRVVFDEGHCIIQWGETFRQEYKEVVDILWLLPETSMCISSATMPPPMVTALVEKFRFGRNYTLFHRSNDRVNIAYTVIKMKHAANSYEDLAFLVPKDWKEGDPLPKKFMVFFDSKKEAEHASRYLAGRVSLALRRKVPWFHAGMTAFFRTEEIQRFSSGATWGLAATDSGGMGLDIRDVLLIVQWKAPPDLNTAMQRFGRGARDPDLQAVAILIAEPSCFYDEHVRKEKQKEQRRLREGQGGRPRKKRRLNIPDPPPREQGVRTAGSNVVDQAGEDSEGESDSDEEHEEPDEEDAAAGVQESVVDEVTGLQVTAASNEDTIGDAQQAVTEEALENALVGGQECGGKRKRGRRSKRTDRALCFFMNAHTLAVPKRCRWYHSNLYFANDKAPSDSQTCCPRCAPRPPVICCDICCPAEVAAMIPVRNDIAPKTKRAPAQAKIAPYTVGDAEDKLERDLLHWRETTARSMYGDYDLYGPDMVLHFRLVGRIVDLAHARKLETVQDLEVHTRWCFARKFGDEILGIVHRHFPKQIPPSPFVSTPLVSRSRENQLSTSASRLQLPPESPLAGRKTRALPTCSVCRTLGHRKNSPLCASRQRGSATTSSDENVPPRVA